MLTPVQYIVRSSALLYFLTPSEADLGRRGRTRATSLFKVLVVHFVHSFFISIHKRSRRARAQALAHTALGPVGFLVYLPLSIINLWI
jgi:hypothetical protein